MLAFLLAHGAEPLVLDQPEDDLDNHLIYDLVVRQIRENKLRRQIIVVTHNPNIVVNGDAEMLHAMEFAARQGQCVISGVGKSSRTGHPGRGLPGHGGGPGGVPIPLSAPGDGVARCLTARKSSWTRSSSARPRFSNSRKCGSNGVR